ncbi:MAG: imidazolonepropionase [Phreatobacter sp.]|uniref:imidazolonepropionase n=1 Tax=Phreatobacter sp. TaxID=1966341 RepID=UPI001A48529C|nr:imidazolonepropionase [Phreatobacter sp.]MBL8567989.1 imidazolonepropionase [Phreatobacter sp.]
MAERWDTLWTNLRLATMVADGRPYGAIEDGAIAIRDGRIAWIGPRAELPANDARARHDGGGRWATPGLIDCHTHLVFGGDRAHEFELRLGGATYEEISRAGGGIRSTVAATRAAGPETLRAAALPRLAALAREGVTTVEVKSGYGLDVETEVKQLRVARSLGVPGGSRIVTTFLGAHALPPEFAGRQTAFIDLVAGPMLDAVAREGLADAVDVFADRIGFTNEETGRVFAAAHDKGIAVKLHADQLTDQDGAAFAARHGALSADHLEYANEAGIAAMARAGTVGVLLPGAFYFLREKQLPPVEAFRRAGTRIALATDANPGSSPALSLLLMLNMGATLFRLTPEEALSGVTRHAAAALGLGGEIGTLETGKAADIAIWDIERPAELTYWIARNPLHLALRAGRPLELPR